MNLREENLLAFEISCAKSFMHDFPEMTVHTLAYTCNSEGELLIETYEGLGKSFIVKVANALRQHGYEVKIEYRVEISLILIIVTRKIVEP